MEDGGGKRAGCGAASHQDRAEPRLMPAVRGKRDRPGERALSIPLDDQPTSPKRTGKRVTMVLLSSVFRPPRLDWTRLRVDWDGGMGEAVGRVPINARHGHPIPRGSRSEGVHRRGAGRRYDRLTGGTAAFQRKIAGPHPPALGPTLLYLSDSSLYSSNGNPPAFALPEIVGVSLTMVPPRHPGPKDSFSRRDRAQPGARAIDRQAGASLKAKSFTTPPGISIPPPGNLLLPVACTQIILARLDDDSDGAD